MAKTTSTEQTPGVLMATVTLIMPHTHGGIDYAIGDQIDVTEAQKAWLAQRGIISAE